MTPNVSLLKLNDMEKENDLTELQLRVFQLEGVCTSNSLTIQELRSMNEFLRNVIEKLISAK